MKKRMQFISALFMAAVITAAVQKSKAQSWNLTGNAGTNATNNFIGTTDNIAFKIRTNNNVRITVSSAGKVGIGITSPAGKLHVKGNTNVSQLIVDAAAGQTNANPLIRLRDNSGNDVLWVHSDHPTNCFLGTSAGQSNNSSSMTSEGKFNTFIGRGAGYQNSFGAYNAALGNQALLNNQNGVENTAIGSDALLNNISGSSNTAVGSLALESNTGNNNTAVGNASLDLNTSGSNNVAIGSHALNSNTDRDNLVAVGVNALNHNGIGAVQSYHATNNTALGHAALYENTIGDGNTATGFMSLFSNTTGYFNTASGIYALYNNISGLQNAAYGLNALYNNLSGNANVAVGTNSGIGSPGISFDQCTFVGAFSYPSVTRTNVAMLGYGIANAQCTGSNQVLLGNTAIGQIRAAVTGITSYSDGRYKTDVKNDIRGLDFITKLNPVSYNVRPGELHKIWGTPDSLTAMIDHSQTETIRYSGFIAQEVEKAAHESGYNFTGIDVPRNEHETYALRYTEFIMPIVKAIKEQQTIIEKQNERIASLEQQLAGVHGAENKLQGNKNTAVEGNMMLSQNSPNPFTEKTIITFNIPSSARQAVIKIFAAEGKEVSSYPISSKGAGQIEISGNTLPAGTYTYMLIVDEKAADSKQMVLTK